ncbi:leucine-rich repeat domain-containing protein [Chitinophaga filiformis]|uniref:WGR domain-containing protein, predicted DNA-binding domain in MolR n=1 Tax=Chitinophaga filiformis TaxID=104663 RepID=A0A1G8C752_CHIFI|nr:WGR domain-containing protein [Chitinophaga filiformis]SDH41245.1 WGR domain-containing protein, predicted DNA-binding domain in MolR [Chitinophaga filiformis]
MLQYFELQEGTSSKFWEISLNANSITTRYGKIGTPGKTTQEDFQDSVKAQQEYDKLVKEKTGKGYQEIIRDGKTLLPGDYTIISEKVAVKRYKLDEYIDALYDDGGKYMLYQGDVAFNGALDTYKHCTAAKDDIYGIIVDGNLTVKGVIFQPDVDSGEHLLVTGNLHAQSINKGGGEFYIKGNLTAEQTIYGYYNHGRLTVEGNTQAVAILADDHSFKFMGDVSGTIVGDQEIEGVEDDYNEITVLLPELIKEKEYANSDKISNYINKGKHILRDEFLPGSNDTQVAKAPKEMAASAKPQILTLEAAKAKVDISSYGPIGEIAFERVLYFGTDLSVEGDLTPDWVKAVLEEHGGPVEVADLLVLVKGGLTVKGDIAPGEDSYPCLLVLGDVKCDVLYSGDEFIYITGNADIRYALDGNYNDGSITITGKTNVPYVLNSNHEMNIKPKGAILINYFSDADNFFAYDYTVKDFQDVMVAAVFEKDTFSRQAFIGLLKARKSPLKKGAVDARQTVLQALDKMKVAREEVKVLDLSDQDLDRFPMLLTTMKSLTQLKLNGNSIKTLPVEIARLEHLEELHLSGCELKTLPVELTQLKHLRVLDLSRNYDLRPQESLSQLTSLRVLNVAECKSFVLTAGILALEELRCDACTDARPVDFPAAILECTGMKRLFMNMNSFKQIPPALTALKELEELYLDGSLGYVRELPDLSGLKKLKVLHASGIYNDPASPLAKHSLLKGFFNILSLEELKIDLYRRWLEDLKPEMFKKIAANLSHDPERLQELSDLQATKVDLGNKKKAGYLRRPMTAEHLEGIGALRQLRILDLSENMLSDLPEEVYNLPGLRSLNLKGNSFKISDRLRIAERLPEVELDLRENWTENEIIDTEAARLWKETADLLEKGNELWFNDAGKPLKAIAIYDQVLANFNSGKVVDKYLLLYTYYAKTNACSNLPMDAAYEKMSEKEKRRYSLLCIETGLKGLSLLPEHILPSTSMGAFYREVIRIVANAVAWAMYEVYEDQANMEEALTIVNKAVECIEDQSEYYIYDSQVRILLRLGRQEEAWQVVKQTLEKDEYFSNFDDIKETKEYKKWLKK